MNLKNILLTVTDLENVNYRKESHFSQTLQHDKKLFFSSFHFFDGNIFSDDFLACSSAPESDAEETCR